ncbi:hypothetical protein ABZ128_10125 [Streptomyces sp. NPDC006326]|uniref:hypothetical protein n=1 Tax=Streptomyces sp. NPDC006326 TaxID=3156752 RepID=UPI00339F4504
MNSAAEEAVMVRRNSRTRWGQKGLRVIVGLVVLCLAVWVGPGVELRVVATFVCGAALLLLAALAIWAALSLFEALAIRRDKKHADARAYEWPSREEGRYADEPEPGGGPSTDGDVDVDAPDGPDY